jgi:hypothetical protein
MERIPQIEQIIIQCKHNHVEEQILHGHGIVFHDMTEYLNVILVIDIHILLNDQK